MMLVIVAAVLLTFGRVCAYAFISWDDEAFISHNPRFIDPGWANVGYFWQHAYLTIYIRVTATVWQLLAWAGGLNASWFHTANVIVHAGNSLLAFLVLRRLLKSDRAAMAGALVFALHPTQVETVAWAAELKDLLAGSGSLAAMTLYFAAIDAPRRRRAWLYLAATVAMALAMLSKPSAMTMPAVVLAVDLLLVRRPWRQTILWLIPWFALSIACAAIARTAQPPITGVSDLGYSAYTTTAERPLIVGHTLAFYIGHVLWPAKLCGDYGHFPPHLLVTDWAKWAWIVPFAVIVAAATSWRRSRLPLAAVAIFVLAPFHVLGWVPFDNQFFSTTADHYLYVAMLGVGLLAGWIATSIPLRAAMIATAVVAVALGVRSFVYAGAWRDSQTLYEHTVRVNPGSWLNQSLLGKLAADRQDWPAAVEHYRLAIAAQPRYNAVYSPLGTALMQLGDPVGAEPMLRRTVELVPDDVRPRLQLAYCLIALGRRDQAIAQLQVAHRLQPNSATIASFLHQLEAATTLPAP